MLDSVKMSNYDSTCLDMLIKVSFWVNVVYLNMPRVVLEFNCEKWTNHVNRKRAVFISGLRLGRF